MPKRTYWQQMAPQLAESIDYWLGRAGGDPSDLNNLRKLNSHELVRMHGVAASLRTLANGLKDRALEDRAWEVGEITADELLTRMHPSKKKQSARTAKQSARTAKAVSQRAAIRRAMRGT
jgi:hypothetical protein